MKPRAKFYLYSRYVHGWLSAVTFLMLLLFSSTGFLLNHNKWFEGKPDQQQISIALPATLIQQARQQENPSMLILDYLRSQQPLVGRFREGEVTAQGVAIQLHSPSGRSKIDVDWTRGTAQIKEQRNNALNVLKNLHKGKNAGTGWSLLIDISAISIFVMSLVGYILFFSMKARFRTAMLLTAFSIMIVVGLAWTAL